MRKVHPTKLKRLQQGMSAYSLILLLIVGGFFALCGIKLIPHYLDYFKLKKALSTLEDEPDASEMTLRKINESLQTKLTMNSLSHIGMDSFVVERTQDGTFLTLDYEIQEPLFANIDVLLTFRHDIEL